MSWLLFHFAPVSIWVRTLEFVSLSLSSGCHSWCAVLHLGENGAHRMRYDGWSCSQVFMNVHTWSGKPLSASQIYFQMRQTWVSSALELDCIAVRTHQSQHPAHDVSVIVGDSKAWLAIVIPRQHSGLGRRPVRLSVSDLQHSATGPNMVTFSMGACIAILQNGGIRSYFHASVEHGRMPPMDPGTIGGISTGFSPYSGRFCVPPYSQNAAVDDPYI